MITAAALSLLAVSDAFSFSPFFTPQKPFPQTQSDANNVLKYTGHQGPYSDRRGYGINRDPPANCKVDQVIMYMRHGERWPSTGSWKSQVKSVDKVLSHRDELNGSLSFAKYWEPIASRNSSWIEEETWAGPYSGLLDAYTFGTEFRRRYYDLYDGQTPIPFFVSAFQRIADTARKFGEGFLNWNYTDIAAVNFIQEENGADTLAPSCTLTNGTSAQTYCPDYGNYTEFKRAAARLNAENPRLNLTWKDALNILFTSAFELNVRGSSPWINVFTSEEWIAFEYYLTSSLYCDVGPGSVTGRIEGSPWVNATRHLLLQGPEKSLPFALTWAHEVNIIMALTTLGIDEPEEWDPTEVHFGPRYTVSDLTPMGARFIIERLECIAGPEVEPSYINHYPAAFNVSLANLTNSTNGSTGSLFASNGTAASNSSTTNYVRLVLNEAVVPLKGCSNGPGYSCELSDYSKYVDNRLKGINFGKQCQLDGGPSYLNFFWNYTTSTENDPDSPYEPAQAQYLDNEGNPEDF